MPVKRVLITAGGTGGHLYPAQALAQQLKNQTSPSEVLFVAGGLQMNRFFDRNQFHFEEIACSPLLIRNPLKLIKGISNLLKGSYQTVGIIKKFKPDVVVGFGSFYTAPILFAARWMKIPILLHEANSVPGKANRWLSSFADKIGIFFPSTASYFNEKAVEVGFPLREGYQLGLQSKAKALASYDLKGDQKTLLIFGGSQGAKGINRIIEEALLDIKQLGLQVIHFTGSQKESEKFRELYQKYEIRSAVKPFETEMHYAWSAADLFIGRSGAATVAESIEFEVPGILIPFPFATDNHQEKNADFLVEVVKSSWKLLETEGNLLGNRLKKFFQEFDGFKMGLKKYKQRENQMTLCELVLNHNKG